MRVRAPSDADPFRMGAYPDIRGPLFNHSYRDSTGSLFCECICSCVSYVSVYLCVYCVMWTLGDTRTWPSHGLVYVCTTAVLPTKLRETEQLCLSWRLFVAVGETGNEIMLRALALRTQSLSQSRTRLGTEYESLISWPHRAYGNEEQLLQCKLECVATPDNMVSHTVHRHDFNLNLSRMLQNICPLQLKLMQLAPL